MAMMNPLDLAEGAGSPCACRYEFERIVYCPTHAAAPEMLALLKGMNGWGQVDFHKVRALLAQIEGGAR